jgi:hypothetical protein
MDAIQFMAGPNNVIENPINERITNSFHKNINNYSLITKTLSAERERTKNYII